MRDPHRRWLLLALTAAALANGACRANAPRKLDVPYEPTPPEVVDAMLRLGEVGPGDVVYDLGCGDGRIVIQAARLGARAIGVELDPQRIREARANAREAGVEGKVEFREGDLFQADVHDATVVMLYLWPHVNLQLRPRLLAQLRPGARIVSHAHDMGDWPPERTIAVDGNRIHRWTVPPRR
jgi:SAM-dependent methyltransferase